MMTPIILRFQGLSYGWYSDKGSEPPHVHVFRGTDRSISSKYWIGKDGITLAHNKAKLSGKEQGLAEKTIALNRDLFLARWVDFFDLH